MNIDLDQAIVKLPRWRTVQVTDAPGSTVMVVWGTVWITQQGDPSDYVLSTGQSFLIRRRGLTLVYALHEAAITLLERAGNAPIADLERVLQPRAPGDHEEGPNAGDLWDAGALARIERAARRARAERVSEFFAALARVVKRASRSLLRVVAHDRSPERSGSEGVDRGATPAA